MTTAPDPAPDLEALARQALRSHPADFDAAARAFARTVERDPAALIALVTREHLTALERAYVQKVQMSDVGHTLRSAVGRVRKGEGGRPRDRWGSVYDDYADSVLATMVVAGKRLAVCTRAEVQKDAAETGRRAAFLAALLALMPDEPDVMVKDAVTPRKAEELWKASAKVAAPAGKKAA